MRCSARRHPRKDLVQALTGNSEIVKVDKQYGVGLSRQVEVTPAAIQVIGDAIPSGSDTTTARDVHGLGRNELLLRRWSFRNRPHCSSQSLEGPDDDGRPVDGCGRLLIFSAA